LAIHEIITGCIKGDAKFQRLLYETYRGYALKIVFRYIYRYEKAQDVVTDGFIKALTHFHQFKNDEEENAEKILMGWLKRIMINCAIDELRKNNMLPEIGGIPEEVWQLTDRADDADKMLLYKDLVTQIKELPPNYRIVFNLYVLDGYTHSQIADILDIPVSSSRSSLSRAKAILQNQITLTEEKKYAEYRT
jgi:RNA polymerase sigma factor (sigma-70 family)